MQLSSEAIRFYEQAGWYISDYCLSDREIEECIAGAERLYRGEFDARYPWSSATMLGDTVRPYSDRSRSRVDQFASFHSDAIRRVVHSPVIAWMGAQLLRSPEVRYYKDILISSAAESRESAIGWHLDISYWPTCIPERMITIYVPLQDRDVSSGTLLMMTGSQRWATRHFNLNLKFDEVEKLRAKFAAEGHVTQLTPLIHRRGQVSFHSSLVIHSTYPNMTPVLQQAAVFGLQAADNRYVPSALKRINPRAVINLNDEIGPKLPDGTPDVKNDKFYPVLYRDSGMHS
jgi:phytanoyl-CoA dioxygenase PhyH